VIWSLDFLFLLLLVGSAVAALTVRDLLSAVVILGAYSFFLALLWAEMGAVDVAFTEASVGAGITTVVFIAAIFQTARRSRD
jgi:energy-converting hydrogenase B subunit D